MLRFLSLLCLLFVQLFADSTTRSKCTLAKMYIPELSAVTLIDANGKKCSGVIQFPVCKGYCKTSESGSHTFPHRIQNSSACTLVQTSIEEIKLENCDEGADDSIRSVKIPMGDRCMCKRFPLD